MRHINDVGASLVGVAARTRVLILPGLAPKGDIKDWLAAGGTREQLDELIEQAPEWIPPTAEEADKAKADTGKAKAVADEQELIDALARPRLLIMTGGAGKRRTSLVSVPALSTPPSMHAVPRGRKKLVRRRCSVIGSSSHGRRPSTPAS